MPELIQLLNLVREARQHVEAGRTADAVAYLEMLEDDLLRMIVAITPEPDEQAH